MQRFAAAGHPEVRFIRQLPLPGDIHVDVEPVVLAKKRAKRSRGARKAAKRRR